MVVLMNGIFYLTKENDLLIANIKSNHKDFESHFTILQFTTKEIFKIGEVLLE